MHSLEPEKMRGPFMNDGWRQVQSITRPHAPADWVTCSLFSANYRVGAASRFLDAAEYRCFVPSKRQPVFVEPLFLGAPANLRGVNLFHPSTAE